MDPHRCPKNVTGFRTHKKAKEQVVTGRLKHCEWGVFLFFNGKIGGEKKRCRCGGGARGVLGGRRGRGGAACSCFFRRARTLYFCFFFAVLALPAFLPCGSGLAPSRAPRGAMHVVSPRAAATAAAALPRPRAPRVNLSNPPPTNSEDRNDEVPPRRLSAAML